MADFAFSTIVADDQDPLRVQGQWLGIYALMIFSGIVK